MTDATWLDKQMGVHAPVWSKTMRLLLTTIILTMLAQPVWAQKMHCAFTMDPDRWPLERLGSASAAIDAVAGSCKAGDHVMVSKMYTDEARFYYEMLVAHPIDYRLMHVGREGAAEIVELPLRDSGTLSQLRLDLATKPRYDPAIRREN